MSRQQARRVLLAAAAALMVWTAAGDPVHAQSRTFSVVLDGNASPVFLDPCTIQNNETGTGHATHMGTITWQTTETVNLCAGFDGGLVQGSFVLTAKDGETVTGTYATVARLDFGTNQVTAAGLYRVTGGTGRFAAASGEGVLTARGSLLPPFEVLGGMDGTISF